MVNESRNGVNGSYPILVGAKPNNTPSWGQSGGKENGSMAGVSETTTAGLDSFRFARRPQSGEQLDSLDLWSPRSSSTAQLRFGGSSLAVPGSLGRTNATFPRHSGRSVRQSNARPFFGTFYAFSIQTFNISYLIALIPCILANYCRALEARPPMGHLGLYTIHTALRCDVMHMMPLGVGNCPAPLWLHRKVSVAERVAQRAS